MKGFWSRALLAAGICCVFPLRNDRDPLEVASSSSLALVVL